jgi:phosphoheptose isomerase
MLRRSNLSQSVDLLCAKLASARRVLVVGNGGIALELVHAVRLYER